MMVPPHSMEAEKAVLGSLLLDNRAIDAVRHLIHPGDFYRQSHGEVYGAMLDLAENREPVDMVTLAEHLAKRGILDGAGGMVGLVDLMDATPTAANAEYHARIVLRHAELRRLLRILQDGQKAVYERENPEDVTARLMGALLERQRKMSGGTFAHICEPIYSFLERVTRGPTQVAEMLMTGISSFDNRIGGLPKGLVTLSGRTGEGKTTVAEWWTLGLARQTPVLFVTMEVPRDILVERFVAMLGSIKSKVIRHGPEEALDAEREHIFETACRLQTMPIWVMDHPEPNVAKITAVVRAIEQREGRPVGCVVIDRLELLETMQPYDEVVNTTRKVRAVKKMQMELQNTVVLLCQLNQDSKRRTDPKPRISDLLGSGAIKNDSQMVVMLYRPAYDGEKTPMASLYIRKNNYGPTGKISVMFDEDYPRFTQVA